MSEQTQEVEPTLALPWEPEKTTEKLGDDGIKFDHLGPMIINIDGTVSRIANWDKMTERERQVSSFTTSFLTLKVAWRRIAARNKERREQLETQ